MIYHYNFTQLSQKPRWIKEQAWGWSQSTTMSTEPSLNATRDKDGGKWCGAWVFLSFLTGERDLNEWRDSFFRHSGRSDQYHKLGAGGGGGKWHTFERLETSSHQKPSPTAELRCGRSYQAPCSARSCLPRSKVTPGLGSRMSCLWIFFQLWQRKDGSQRDSMFGLLEASGNHWDLSPTKTCYTPTCFLGIPLLLLAALGGWAQLVIPGSVFLGLVVSGGCLVLTLILLVNHPHFWLLKSMLLYTTGSSLAIQSEVQGGLYFP